MACMKKVVVYMPDDLLAEIDAEADRTGASRSAVMRDLTYASVRRRRVNRATEMQTLLRHTGPHGGNVAERVKQMRPRDPWSRLRTFAEYDVRRRLIQASTLTSMSSGALSSRLSQIYTKEAATTETSSWAIAPCF